MSTSSKKFMLESYDKHQFEVEESEAVASETIKGLIEALIHDDDDCANSVIPLPNVSGTILTKVTEFMKKYAGKTDKDKVATSAEEEALEAFNKEFLDVDQNTLFDLILAANYLEMKKLLDLTCQTVADMMKGKTPEQIRETFHIVNDYTKEEEDEVRRENAWAFE